MAKPKINQSDLDEVMKRAGVPADIQAKITASNMDDTPVVGGGSTQRPKVASI